MKTLPSVERLNMIQAQWMALDPHAPKPEQQRVFAMMKEYPRCYVSGHDGKGVVMIDSMPYNQATDLAWCFDYCRKIGGRTDIAWHGQLGQWYATAQCSCGKVFEPLNGEHARCPDCMGAQLARAEHECGVQ